MPFPICSICGLRHRRDRACHSNSRPQQYALAGIIITRIGGTMEYVHPEVPHSCGLLDNICPHCCAHFWQDENFSCCDKGQIHFCTEQSVSSEIQNLLSSTHFMDHIRQYNTAMAMASVGHDAKILSGGPSSVILSGKTFHRVAGGLFAGNGWNANFSQIYLLDSEEASNVRNELHHNALRTPVLAQLHNVMLRDNPWVRQFRKAAIEAVPLQWKWDGSDVNNAMVLGSMIAAPGENRNIIIQLHDAPPQLISDLHRLYHPLAYPILFPSGMTGWYLGMQSVNGGRITRTQYLKYLLMRRSELSHIQQCGKLTLEFYCDAWASHEASLMEFHRRPAQQSLYRSASRSVLIDQLPLSDAHDIGIPTRTILPSSHVGSPRFYHTLFLNAMALPRKYGKPDLFLTMTANPNWDEIQSNIPQQSHWQFHPDIIARVFMIKVFNLLKDIRDKKIFGDVAAIVWRIEWQMRGLPHLHMLIILRKHILTSADIDSYVSAEIPEPNTDSLLHQLIMANNIHKPCDTCEDATCHRDGTCKRNFPKKMASFTVITGDKFPIYRRRGLHFGTVTDYNNVSRPITDEWVVPFSPYLTLKYRCHINLEVAAHVKCFKYLYKYVLKPPDSAAIIVDEIEAYLQGRMLSASEAVFRILGLRLHQEWPPVICLNIHLPNHERLIFDPTVSREELADSPEGDTTLNAWFKLNNECVEARQYLYIDIPEHYCWNINIKRWEKRKYQNKIAVGRTYAVSPRNTELYALRLLLNVVRGALSWLCLLNVDGWICSTFHEAALARGLLTSDVSHYSTFAEIINNVTSPSSACQIFAQFLLNVQVAQPQELFDMFVDHMVDGDMTNRNILLALRNIDRELRYNHSSISAFGFETIIQDDLLNADTEQYATDYASKYAELYEICSDEQRNIVDQIISAITTACPTNVFIIQGGAGTGKTLMINCLAAALYVQNKKIVCVASSALAASLLPHGKTAHSALGIPVPVYEDSYCRLDPVERQHLRSCDAIIWDEMSMVHHNVADCVDSTLQDIHHNSLPFGGKVMVFVGDFKQLPPVVVRGKGEFATLRKCNWWLTAFKVVLTRNFRALENQSFIENLESIGSGLLQYATIPEESICYTEDDLIQRVLGDNILDVAADNCMILTLKVQDAMEINTKVINMIPGEAYVALASDEYPVDEHHLPSEYIAGLAIPGAPNFAIQLKVGARYMIIKNYAVGIVNGTLCKLMSHSTSVVHMQLLTGNRQGSIVMLPKCTFSILPGAIIYTY